MKQCICRANRQTMKRVKKYNTFNELKNTKAKSSDAPSVLRKHSAFEKLMKEMTSPASQNSARKSTKR